MRPQFASQGLLGIEGAPSMPQIEQFLKGIWNTFW
jgi:hypothetical protein